MTDAINSHSRRMYNAQKKTRADLATPAPAVKVKALVWTHGGIESHGTMPFGFYLIANCHEEGFGLWGVGADIEDEPNLGYFDSIEAAKAAAQADYEARILAALEPATPLDDPRVKEAERMLKHYGSRDAGGMAQARAALSALEENK